jgi:hypothetical protein
MDGSIFIRGSSLFLLSPPPSLLIALPQQPPASPLTLLVGLTKAPPGPLELGTGKGRSAGPSRSPSGNPLSAATSPYTDFSRSFSNSSSSSSTHSNGYYHHQQAPKPQRSRSGTVTAADEEVVQFSSRDSALLSPTLNSSASSSFRQHLDDGSRSSSPYGSRPASPPGANEARSGWRKVGEELTAEEEQERRERLEQEENERELMA